MQPSPEDSLSMMDALGIVVFESAGPGKITLLSRRPAWLQTLADGPIDVDSTFPFLTGFLIAAVTFWEHGESGCLRSDIWEQTPLNHELEHQTFAFRASALSTGARHFLLIEHLEQEYEEFRDALQRAREKSLDNERLERLSKVLSLANQEAGRAVREKGESLAAIGHDLRTPLNAMLGFSTLLLQERAGPLNKKQRGYLERVTQAARQLRGLIEDVLDLSKIDAGVLKLRVEDFPFEEVLTDVLSTLEPLARAKQITIQTAPAACKSTISADRVRVRQILFNLLGNAIKFTGEWGTIAIAAQQTPNFLEVCITDTGRGISSADQSAVFRKFYQADSEQKVEGAGLGLAITRRLIEQHGGRIWLESTPGAGSKFFFTLPTAGHAMAATAS